MKFTRKYVVTGLSALYFIAVIISVFTSCKQNKNNLNNKIDDYSSTQSSAKYSESNKKEKMKTVEQIIINPDPYKSYNLAQGYKVDNIVYISGQAAYGNDGKLIGINNFELQAEQTFQNLKKVLEAGGSSFKNVIKVTIFLKDMGNFNKIVSLRHKYFVPPYPADTIVEISSLYSPDALIEIEAIAIEDNAVQTK